MKAQLLTLTVALTLASCGGSSSPISPAPTPTPTPTPTPSTGNELARYATLWLRDGTGQLLGQRAADTLDASGFPNLPMTVTRAEASITFKGDFFQVNFTGTMSGSEFSATGDKPLEGGGGTCQNGGGFFPQLPGVSTLTGRFSSDTVMTASEVNTYPLPLAALSPIRGSGRLRG